jgi:cytochrome c oxidase subunit 2
MSIFTPPDDWFQAPKGAERIWVGLALMWCLVMFVMMPIWHFKGKQTSLGESYLVEPGDFKDRVQRFIDTNKVAEDESGYDICEPAPGGDAYMIGNNWKWYPILKLKKGQEYRLHVSSGDYQHGFCLLPMNMNFVVLPGYDHVLTVTPTQTGEFQLICNEFCGALHHLMVGKIIVTE